MSANERVNAPVSTGELERRWAAVRAAMTARGVDVLIMQNNNDFMGGYVKYFTDIPATNGYPLTAIFPRDDLMTMIGQGPFGHDQALAGGTDGLRRGVGRVMSSPSFTPVSYTREYDAELAARALAPFGKGVVGLVGSAQLPYAFVDHLKRGVLAGAKLVEASDLVDEIRAIKSEEEIAGHRKACAMQDAMMKEVAAKLRPGLRDQEVVAIARSVASSWGSEQGWYMAASAPVGASAPMAPPHQQNRVIREGDQFCILLENSGPGGFYTELGRTFVLGKANQEMKDEFAFVLEARRFALSLLREGASCAAISEEFNAFMRAHGRPEEKRVFCHSQGYDMVERPLIRRDETMTIRRDMVLACHPTYVTERTYSWICDNFLIGGNGPERMHAFEERIVELG
jgi:Xaa-Pro aminopeptidase